ncbi:MAG: CpsD/CapB family tyrosine-protein kinase [Anaerolineae bacterium]|nr:MAG: CpsD/CapB family tyrosine-protein kinase [Anaerolineae bacterium]
MDLITLTNPRSAAAEAYRTLRTNLMFSGVDTMLRRIAVTSPLGLEDKSLALANLAVTLAQGERQTLIVDADLRQPAQHLLWGIENTRGFTDMILDEAAFNNPPLQSTPVVGLSVLPSGALPANPADVLASRRMDDVITRLSELAEYILFDVPPVLAATDAAVFGRKLDGVLLVIRAGKTRRDQTARAKEQLERVQVNIVGAVLTNAPGVKNSYGRS